MACKRLPLPGRTHRIMRKTAIRIKGVPCWREDGKRVRVPPGPCEVDELGGTVHLYWRQYGREYVEILLDTDYLRCLADRAIQLLP